ncbi:hypothetical protein CSC2_48050 [Clostridium zeae]|uniref:ASCH domain-containing protein n=1 Tax=Clostridium zeae TaxID=2759022 RepID=A0ABQ1EHH4_9CLOT|nr:hypothetical protein [Clostridium zeae]GFZ34279.1 hypothetical protein CSC2_48050 [Clostridium zeae]
MEYDMILSIRPEYVKEIISGRKIYEFRKFCPGRPIDKIYIYETSPTKKIIGYFNYSGVIIDDKYSVWTKCCSSSGISKENYLNYYSNSSSAYAFKITNLNILKSSIDPYKIIDNFVAPQSYRYVKRGIIDEFICDLV